MAITTAKGTQIQLGDAASPSTFATIGQVRSITGPTTKPHIVDITTHDTAGFWRKKLAVLIDAGETSFEVNFDKADATHAFTTGLWSLLVALTKRGYKLLFPSTAGQMLFSAYVGDHSFAAPVDNVLSAKISLAITDAITAS
jgi:predicted secreted protein